MAATIFVIVALCLACGLASPVKDEIAWLTSRVSELESTHKDLDKSLTEMNMNLTKPAFSAYLTQNVTILGETIIQFDGIVYNSGNHYDPGFGFFQCPDTASYFFRLSIASPAGKVSQVYLTVDSPSGVRAIVPKTYMVNVADVSGIHSAGIVVQCDANAYVYAITDDADTENVSMLAHLTSFTGYRL